MDGLLTLGVGLQFAAAPFLGAMLAQLLLTPSGYDTSFFAVLGLVTSALTAAVCRHPEAAPPRQWRTAPLLVFAPFVLWLAEMNAPAALFWHAISAGAFYNTEPGKKFVYLRLWVVSTLAVLLYSQSPASGAEVQWLFLVHGALWAGVAHFAFAAPALSKK